MKYKNRCFFTDYFLLHAIVRSYFSFCRCTFCFTLAYKATYETKMYTARTPVSVQNFDQMYQIA